MSVRPSVSGILYRGNARIGKYASRQDIGARNVYLSRIQIGQLRTRQATANRLGLGQSCGLRPRSAMQREQHNR